MPQNIAEFRIIGRIGKITAKDKVTFIDVAANYPYQKDGEWHDRTVWNTVTLFSKIAERAQHLDKGDLVHITGRVGQNSFEKDGTTHYTVELVVESISRLAKPAEQHEDA